MNKICDNCETVAHCMKNGCVRKQPVISAGPITPEMLRPWTQQERDELTAVLKKHFVIKPKKGSYEAVFGYLGMTPDELGNYIIELQEKAAQPAPAQEPKAQVVCDPDGSNKRVIFTSYKALYETPLGSYLYTTPPAAQRPWTGLTDEQRRTIIAKLSEADYADSYEWDNALFDAIEAKLWEQNT